MEQILRNFLTILAKKWWIMSAQHKATQHKTMEKEYHYIKNKISLKRKEVVDADDSVCLIYSFKDENYLLSSNTALGNAFAYVAFKSYL